MKSNIHVPYCTTCNAHSKTIWRRRWHDNREPSCGTRTFPFPRESLEWSDQSSNLQFKTLRLETKIQHVEKNTQGATSRSPGRDAVAATRISSPPVEEATASHVSRLADEGVAAPPRLHPRRRGAGLRGGHRPGAGRRPRPATVRLASGGQRRGRLALVRRAGGGRASSDGSGPRPRPAPTQGDGAPRGLALVRPGIGASAGGSAAPGGTRATSLPLPPRRERPCCRHGPALAW